MQRVRLVKRVDIGTLPFPSVQIERDLIGRIIELYYDYISINVTYNQEWFEETNNLVTYTQIIQEQE